MDPKCTTNNHSAVIKKTFENDRLYRLLMEKNTSGMPVWMMRQAGRYLDEYRALRSRFPDFMTLCRHAEATTELALQPLRRFPFDAAILFSDILTIADSLDLGLSFVPNVGPVLSNPIASAQDISSLPFEECVDRLDYVYNAVSALRAALGNRLPMIGFCGSPWTQSCYMISGRSEPNFIKTRTFAYANPHAMQALITQLALVSAEYLYRQYQAGADILFVIDTWGVVLPDASFDCYSAQALVTIGNRLKDLGCHAPLLFYSKGLTPARIAFFAHTPLLKCIGVDWTASLSQLQTQFPQFIFQGNLDPCILHAGPVVTQQHTHQMLQSIVARDRYIANLGHGILPHTPPESVRAFVDTVHHF